MQDMLDLVQLHIFLMTGNPYSVADSEAYRDYIRLLRPNYQPAGSCKLTNWDGFDIRSAMLDCQTERCMFPKQSSY